MPEGCASPLDENPGRPTTSNTASGAPITLYGIIKISFVLASLRSLQGVSHASYSRPLEKTDSAACISRRVAALVSRRECLECFEDLSEKI